MKAGKSFVNCKSRCCQELLFLTDISRSQQPSLPEKSATDEDLGGYLMLYTCIVIDWSYTSIIYIHTCMHTYVRTYIHTYIHVYDIYGALARVVSFEMCHLRSLGRVANFKNEAFRNGGKRFFGVFNMLHMLPYDHQGVGGCINVLDAYFPCVTEHVHIAHAVVWSSRGWGVCINVLDEHFSDVTEHVHVAHAVVWSSGGVY